MRILITGSGGLIGGIVYDSLWQNGHEVMGVDHYEEKRLELRRNINDPLAGTRVDMPMDLLEAKKHSLVSMLEGVDVLIHLAADANPSNDDDSMMRNNVELPRRLLDSAVEAGVRRVILASSGLVQVGLEKELTETGPLEGQMLRLEHGIAPNSMYGVSKAWVEALGRMHNEKHGLEVVVIRLGTVILDEAEHWQRGGRLQATAFLAEDVRGFFSAAVEQDLTTQGGFLLTSAQSDSPKRFISLEPGLSVLGWTPIKWPKGPGY